MRKNDPVELESKLKVEQALARRFRKECLRLSRELSSSRREIEHLKGSVRALMGSWTWRVAALANRVIAKLLMIRKGAPAWAHLIASLDSESVSPPASALENVGHRDQASGLYAAQSTNDAGLHRIEGAALLDYSQLPNYHIRICCVIGDGPWSAPQSPGIDIISTPKSERLEVDACDAVVAIVGPSTQAADLQGVLTAADLKQIPSAAVGSTADMDRCAATLAAFDRTATVDGDGDRRLVISERLDWCRFAHELAVLGAGREREIPFVASAYLAENPDVARAIEQGDFRDAQDHWSLLGREEFIRGYRSFRVRARRTSLGLREADEQIRRRAETEFESWRRRPRISILVPIYQVDLKWLRAAVESVVGQIYPEWELCLVDDGSQDPKIRDYLKSLHDPRIRVKVLEDNRGIAAATNEALGLAGGDYLGLLDHDDELTLDALWLVARVIRDFDPDLIYSDEAKLDLSGQVVEPHFKADFSRALICSQNYISHFGVYRRSIVGSIGGFRDGYEGSQDHDLLLRFLHRATSVFHVPQVLYYWRKVPRSTASRFGEKNYAWDSGVHALEDLQRQTGSGAQVAKGRFPGTYRLRHPIKSNPKISILVPFRDNPDLLDQLLESLLEKTTYENFEFIGIDNQSRRRKTRESMERWQRRDRRVRFLEFDAPFNFSAINNFAAEQAGGEHLLLLNNDISIIEPDWLTALLEFSQLPGVGAVGGLLLYPDNSIQHAGVILGIGGVAGHSHKYLPVEQPGYFCRPHLIQNVSAVTGACLMVKRELYIALGGLEEDNLTIAFNDIDFCLRLRERGFENVYTPYCRLYHHESKSRGHEDTVHKQRRFKREADYMRNRHCLALSYGDPFYNPNLSVSRENFSLREA